MAEALTTQGIALARLGKTERAQLTIQRAIEVAHQAGSLNQAGIAALTLIEEINDLSGEILSSAYEQAGEWLTETQSNALLLRFKRAPSSTAGQVNKEHVIAKVVGPTETKLWYSAHTTPKAKQADLVRQHKASPGPSTFCTKDEDRASS